MHDCVFVQNFLREKASVALAASEPLVFAFLVFVMIVGWFCADSVVTISDFVVVVALALFVVIQEKRNATLERRTRFVYNNGIVFYIENKYKNLIVVIVVYLWLLSATRSEVYSLYRLCRKIVICHLFVLISIILAGQTGRPRFQ